MAHRSSFSVWNWTFTIYLIFLFLVRGLHCFYGFPPVDYKKGDDLKVKVKSLTSARTQLPFSYYSLPFCRPEKIENGVETLGEVLLGDRSENSLYVAKFMDHQHCSIICRIQLDNKGAKELKEMINNYYMVNMVLDNLPLVHPIKLRGLQPRIIYQLGFPVGFGGYPYSHSKGENYIYNHLSFSIKYYQDKRTNSTRIVGFEVKPFSVKHIYKGVWEGRNTHLLTCDPVLKVMVLNSDDPQEVEEGQEVIFTYDIEYQESDLDYAARWDAYLATTSEDEIHWFSIVNTLASLLLISGILALIVRRIYHDIMKINDLETQDKEETRWKLIHGDVFRPPNNSDMLCIHVGTGVQLIGMILGTLLFAILGFLSPFNRVDLIKIILLLWISMSFCAGYVSARLYKMFKGTEWKKIALKTAFTFPATICIMFCLLNALLWGQKSSAAMPYHTMFAVVLLWVGTSVPLIFMGSFFGFNKAVVNDPVNINSLHRQIPQHVWYKNPILLTLMGGILPFASILVEFYFSLTATWQNQFYWFSSLHLLVFIIFIVTCAEITIILYYSQLCREDYHWWWRSYLTSGSSALYLFLYSTFYMFARLGITNRVSVLLFVGYTVLVSYLFFILTGTIGFFASFWFTRLLYSSVKID